MVRRPPDHAAQRERFTEDLLAIMTVEEKVGQMVLAKAPDSGGPRDLEVIEEQLKRGVVGGLVGTFSADELARFQRIAIEETRLGIPLLVAAPSGRGDEVVMPTPFALAASWHPEMVERAARVVAAEARDRGTNWLLGPEVSLCSGPGDENLAATWGVSGLLARKLAAAAVRGLQFEGREEAGVLACLRVDDPSWTARRSAARLTDKLRLVAGVIREAPPGSAALGAASWPSPDAVERADDTSLSITRPGGFEGIDLAQWAEIARAAGQELTDPPYEGLALDAVVAAVEDGRVTALQLDDAVRKIIAAKYDLGLFRSESPDELASPKSPPDFNRMVALEAARRSIVLLRNDPALLPLDVHSGKVLVVGHAAADRSLAVGGEALQASSLIDGLEEAGLEHTYVPGLALRRDQDQTPPEKLVDADHMAIGMASEAARRAGTVIVGLDDVSERCEAQRTLLEALRAANPNIVLVTLGARPTDPVIRGAKLPSVLHAGGLGTMSGRAIADVLTGAFAPQGRLPLELVDKGGIGLSLGHGLGYSDFGLGETTIELSHDRIVVSTVLHNVGQREGAETVQIYLRRPKGRGLGAAELADFQRVTLAAKETRRLLFEIGGSRMGRFERDGHFVIDAGAYEISVGLSEARAHAHRLAVPRAVTEAMERGLSSEPLPALFGKMRNAG